MLVLKLILLSVVRPILAAPSHRHGNDVNASSLIVQTSSGILHGAINESVPDVRQWLGVPFAQSPVGDLRFGLPQPLPANASTRNFDASNFGPSCPQYESTIPSVYNKVVREFFIWGSSGDDCLSVSIWAPLNPVNESLPVFIWIYGGGSTTGGSSVPYQNPQKWVSRTQAHIVVSLQYRLNFLGSPNAPYEGGNLPLSYFDARLAMEWTRDNIAAFGGDSSRMVLWGQSAGASLTDTESLGNPEDPIVSGYIQDSGALYDVSSAYTDKSHANFTFMANQFACTGNSSALVACMRQVPQADIESFIQFWVDAGRTPALSFQSQKDNQTTWINATQAYVEGHFAKVPKILGHVVKDGTSLVAMPPYPYDTPPNATLVDARTKRTKCPIISEATIRESLNVTTYRFMYDGNFTNISPLYWMGAYHSSELPLVFGTYGDFRGPGTAFEKATSETMQDFWLAFARDPENGPASIGWPKYADGSVTIFGGLNDGVEYTHRAVPKAEIEAECQGYKYGS